MVPPRTEYSNVKRHFSESKCTNVWQGVTRWVISGTLLRRSWDICSTKMSKMRRRKSKRSTIDMKSSPLSSLITIKNRQGIHSTELRCRYWKLSIKFKGSRQRNPFKNSELKIKERSRLSLNTPAILRMMGNFMSLVMLHLGVITSWVLPTLWCNCVLKWNSWLSKSMRSSRTH